MSDEGKYGEPWEVVEYEDLGGFPGLMIFDASEREIELDSWRASADRAVACVNACASIPDPAALVEAARRVVSNGLHENTDLTSEEQEDLRDLRTALNPEEPDDGD